MRRSTPTLLALAVTTFALLAFAPLSEARVVVGAYNPLLGGGSGAGIAVNSTGAGGVAPGTVYVGGPFDNSVTRVSPSGAFERAWGFDVDSAGGTGFEICTVAASCKAGIATPTTANGGQLNHPAGIAIDPSSGDVYVSETGNRRISEFDADGNFIRTFGWDVVISGGTGDVPGPAVNETQSVTLGANTTGGAFNLSFNTRSTATTGSGRRTSGSNVLTSVTTSSGAFAVGQPITGTGIPAGTTISSCSPSCGAGATSLTLSAAATSGANARTTLTAYDIPWNASAATVQARLEALSTIGAGNVTVSGSNGGPYTVTFQGAFANTNVTQMEGDANGLSVSGGTASVSVVTTAGGNPQGYEICAVAAECKQAAVTALDAGKEAYGGRFGEPSGLTFDSSGNLWAADPRASRFQEFDSSGNFIAAYGWDVDALGGGGALEKCTSTAPGACQAATTGSAPGQFQIADSFRTTPNSLAFDSAGNLYAIDVSAAADVRRVQRFDPTMTSATDFATGPLSAFTIQNVDRLVATDGGSRIAVTVGGTGGKRPIVELDLGGDLVETSVPDDPFIDYGGLAYDPSSGHLYATYNSLHYPYEVLVLGNVPAPAPTLDPVTTFGSRTATFTGAVDPMGGLVSCTFQYSTDQVRWTDVPEPDCASLAPGGGAQAIGQDATGLDPFTHYFVRLRVSRPLDDSTAVYSSPEREFTTEALPPDISNVGARLIDDTSATAVGLVNPQKAPTAYHFEYGTAGPCDSSPCDSSPEQSLAAGTATPTPVSSQLVNLTPDTTYHLRLIADNASGGDPSESTDVTFHTRATALVADQRGYEMVSPVDKNGSDALSGWQLATVSPFGGAFGFCSDALFGEPSGVQLSFCANYVSLRSEAGWQTQAATPYACGSDTVGGTQGYGTFLDPFIRLSPDLHSGAFLQPEAAGCPLPPLDPNAKVPQKNLYRVDYLADPHTYQLLSPEAVSVSPNFSDNAGTVAATSEDFKHIVYTSQSVQVDGAPAGAFDKVYEWDNGALRLASVMPDGAAASAAAAAPGGVVAIVGGKLGLGGLVNAVSTNGSRIFFQTPVGGASQELYLRQGGSATYWVSQQECSPACPDNTGPETMVFATPDGSKAFFTTPGKLTNDDTSPTGNDLYMFTQPADPIANPPSTDPDNLILLSKDNEPSDGTGAGVLDVLGVSDDGNVVYFAATNQIVAGAPTATGPKLYRWSWNGGSPSVAYLATLDSGDSGNWDPGQAKANEERLVSADGKYLLINAALALDPVDDHDTSRDYYRWDQASGWLCVSCKVLGGPSLGDASGPARTSLNGLRRIVMSEDGQRIFFSTPNALVPEDANGTGGCPVAQGTYPCSDVYEWQDGRLSLITPGNGSFGVLFVGASADGKDVFFATNEKLVGWDVDSYRDVYDARIDGGFPEPAAGVPCDLNAGACEGAGSSAPDTTGAGTAAFQGPPDPRPTFRDSNRRGCPKSKRKVRRHGKARCVKKHHERHHRRAANHKGRAAR